MRRYLSSAHRPNTPGEAQGRSYEAWLEILAAMAWLG